MVRPFAFHPAVPFAEQDFQTFATRAGFSTDGLDQEQLAYCSKATFQLVKAEKFSKAAVASSAFGFDASKGDLFNITDEKYTASAEKLTLEITVYHEDISVWNGNVKGATKVREME